jgi:hypothetical protein
VQGSLDARPVNTELKCDSRRTVRGRGCRSMGALGGRSDRKRAKAVRRAGRLGHSGRDPGG